MGRCSSMCMPLMMALVLMMSFNFIGFAEAQTSGVPSCAQNLIPCAQYINSTNPPSSCCNPLKQTVETQLTCLCNLLNTPGLLQSFGINVTAAFELSRHCGVTTNVNSCKASHSAPPPSSLETPATPGGDRGGAGRVAFTGLSSLLLFWASMLF